MVKPPRKAALSMNSTIGPSHCALTAKLPSRLEAPFHPPVLLIDIRGKMKTISRQISCGAIIEVNCGHRNIMIVCMYLTC